MKPAKERKRKERPLTNYFSSKKNASDEQQIDIRKAKKTQAVESTVSEDAAEATNVARKEAKTEKNDKPADKVRIGAAEQGEESSCGFRESSSFASSDRSDRTAQVLQETTNDTSVETSRKEAASLNDKNSKATNNQSSGWTRLGARLQNPTCKNICHQLVHRSIHSSKIKVPSIPWKSPSWFELRSSSCGVRCLAWDEMGVLLAVAFDNSTVCIYDWDMVVAADLKGRNKRVRQQNLKQKSRFAIEPILTIPRISRVSDLTWNPFKPDELAVVSCPAGLVYLFDLAEVAAWQQKGSRGQPPKRVLAGYKVSVSHEMKVVFVGNGDFAVVSLGNALICYRLKSKPSVKWRFKYKDPVTCMAVLCQDVVILGSSVGNFVLLNWFHMERGSFSVEPTPKIIDEWNSVRGLATPSMVAIREIRVEKGPYLSVEQCKWGHHQIMWVNASGWMLSTMLVAPNRRCGRSEIIHSTKPVRYVNAHGEKLETLKQAWSMPASAVPCNSTESVFCWEKVADATQVLNTNNDLYALEASPQTLQRENKPFLLWWSKNDGQISTIPLSRRRGRPTAIAIHPNHEWLVLGTAKYGLYILNARNKVD